MENLDMNALWANIQLLATDLATDIVVALCIFVVGKWIARAFSGITRRAMVKAKVDDTLVSFLGNTVYVLVMVAVFLAILDRLGIETTSVIAILGAAGLAVGLALQGSLSNFASGVLLILFRPFKVGDLIDAAGVLGTVDAINIFTTEVTTLDHKLVIVPNAKMTADNITNLSAKDCLRVDLVIGVGYGEDIDVVRAAINEVLGKDERILAEPAPSVTVLELNNSSVDFAVRPHCKTADYWDVYFDTTENIKKAFDAKGIQIPFPQRDVHLYREED
jgi:small conductance mechanosensitive channel